VTKTRLCGQVAAPEKGGTERCYTPEPLKAKANSCGLRMSAVLSHVLFVNSAQF
jgi:hypothetical protein